jgi:prolyl-tRNA editing enzyme YbaK/EbsC (Cys-tRNA(Pro) deacylase)
VIELSRPGTENIVDVASRKGVTLDIQPTPSSMRSVEDVAAAVQVEVGQIVKSLVFVAPRPAGRLAVIVCLASGLNQIDLNRLAAVSGEVNIREATTREAYDLTGYTARSIPPFGHGREVRTVMDQDLSNYQWVWAAAGTDRSVFRVAPRTLQMLSNALVAPVAKTSWLSAATAASIEPRLPFRAGAGA